MNKRYLSIWFRYLLADWQLISRPDLKEVPFVFASPLAGRSIITALSPLAKEQGIAIDMWTADAKALCPALLVLDSKQEQVIALLNELGEWCIRFSPTVMIDDFSKDGLCLEVSGCTHLWGGEREYMKEVYSKLKAKGYTIRMAMADTIGAAWAVSRYGTLSPLVPSRAHHQALLALPPQALRLPEITLTKLRKLGFRQLNSLLTIPSSVLKRRFGADLLLRLEQALGSQEERIQAIALAPTFQERLASLEPIKTRSGIEWAIKHLLENLCLSLQKQGKGLRQGILTCYRIDGEACGISIGTSAPSHHVQHLVSLFQLKIEQIRPALGIELFILEAPKVENVLPQQDRLWASKPQLNDQHISRLLDRIASKISPNVIQRYLPSTHYWPERSLKKAISIHEQPLSDWRMDKPRPTELLKNPERIEVMAIIPDHPPSFFIYKGKQHSIIKADGPERIEQEWWLEQGEHRDYYQVEDEQGQRYWLFRLGHYTEQGYKWFIHGFFA